MNEKQFKVYLLTALSTIAESEGGVPNGHLYTALMGKLTFDQYSAVIATAKRAGWIKESGNLLTCTPEGKVLGDKVSKAFATPVA